MGEIKRQNVTNEHILFISGLIHLLEHQFHWEDGATELRDYRVKLMNLQGASS